MCQHRTWGTTCSVLGRISWKKTRSWQTSIRNLKHTPSWTKFNQVEAISNNYQVQQMSRRLTNLLDVAIKCSQIFIKKWAPAPELPFGNTKAASIESSLVHSDWENLEENHGFNWCSPKQSHETKKPVEGTEKAAGLKFETLENHGCTSQIWRFFRWFQAAPRHARRAGWSWAKSSWIRWVPRWSYQIRQNPNDSFYARELWMIKTMVKWAIWLSGKSMEIIRTSLVGLSP